MVTTFFFSLLFNYYGFVSKILPAFFFGFYPLQPFGVNQPGPYIMYTTVDANGYLKNGSGKRNSLWEHPRHSLSVFVLLSNPGSWKGDRGKWEWFQWCLQFTMPNPPMFSSFFTDCILLQTLQWHYFFICPVPVGFEQLAVAKELLGKISSVCEIA